MTFCCASPWQALLPNYGFTAILANWQFLIERGEISAVVEERPKTRQETGHITGRPVVAKLEGMLFTPIPILDHGFIRVVDYMGDDAAIVQAARVSYGRGTKKASEDRALILYLLRHNHTTPFEMAEIKLHVKLPIFVARQWIRHRTANVNEYSARYSVLDREFYIPEASKVASQSDANRQGRSGALSDAEAHKIIELLRRDSELNYDNYLWMLNETPSGEVLDRNRSGIARELARIGLSLNTYTQWYWKIDLHNFLNFIRLRIDRHAQYEIRAYAEVLLRILQAWVPVTHEAFVEHHLESVSLSKSAVSIIRRLLAGEKVTFEKSGVSKREWNDLVEAFQIKV
jgi:thymidylate synthase (FAD)